MIQVTPRLLCPEQNPPLTGPKRVALHSMFRLICAANQLVVNDVAYEFSMPLFGCAPSEGRRLAKSIHLLDAGSVCSDRLVRQLEELTGLRGLGNLTLAEFTGLEGLAKLATRPYRKWCAYCYHEDVQNQEPVYDRLLWSIDLVKTCPTHKVPLSVDCRHCGGQRAPILFGRDISGFCPRCFNWLGESTRTPPIDDDLGSYQRWIAQSFSDLLEKPLNIQGSLLENVHRSIRDLADLHHEGKSSHLARQIRRNKSVVSTWLTSNSNPAWDAVCDISYVYQQPLHDLLEGQIHKITPPQLLSLPSSARPRQGARRKRPITRDTEVISRLLNEVIAGLHPNLTSIRAVAARLRMDPREIYRLDSDSAKSTSLALAARRSALRTQRARHRADEIESALQGVSKVFITFTRSVTRRSMEEEFSKQGIKLRRPENKALLLTLRHMVAVGLASGATSVSGASGNWRAPNVSGNL